MELITRNLARVCCVAVLLAAQPAKPILAADLSRENVLSSINRSIQYLRSQQQADGSWSAGNVGQYQTGVNALVVLSLLSAGATLDDPVVQKGLNKLRQNMPDTTYETSLVISALALAKDGNRDRVRLTQLTKRLEDAQISRGETAGLWSYGVGGPGQRGGGDNSNGQFAILGLRDAVHAGIPVDQSVWKLANDYWRRAQNADGGWGYKPRDGDSRGSMTVAGISSLVIISSMLEDESDLNPDGTPNCCGLADPDDVLERGLKWMEGHFSVGTNPGSGTWLLYYLYGMERAGRLSGRRFFGRGADGKGNDWYREGAAFLVERQSRRDGSWIGVGAMENNPVIGTSLALLFLSKGMSPVLFNKLEYGTAAPANIRNRLAQNAAANDGWKQHPHDIRNLTELITGLEHWPKLMSWQTVRLQDVIDQGSVSDLQQGAILYIAGREDPEFTDAQVEMLKEYINVGGFIFAVNSCSSADFDRGFRSLIARMYPHGEAELKRLEADHPVFISEYLLDPETVELHGVDYGCRTAIIYSPDDVACLWDKWMRVDPPGRSIRLRSMIERATRIGVNVAAYATGREPPLKPLENLTAAEGGELDRIQRGFLQVAKLRHAGGWNTAPQALRNLLMALNRTVGLSASTQHRELVLTDRNILRYPLLYMHGRTRFDLGELERERLTQYLQNGGVLFADACCGSPQFDQSFRRMANELFPGKTLERIPPNHEMFTSDIGHDIRAVKRRVRATTGPDVPLENRIQAGEPFLEGIEVDGRYVVIYSKYDISCALERQASVACDGYVDEDAERIAVNVLLYAMLQDVRYAPEVLRSREP